MARIRRGGGVPYMRHPALPVCVEEGGTTPHVEEEGKGEGKGRGTRSKRGRGYANCVCILSPPLYAPLRMQMHTQRRAGTDSSGRGGGGKRIVPPSHVSQGIHIDALFTCNFCFCLFIFTLLSK